MNATSQKTTLWPFRTPFDDYLDTEDYSITNDDNSDNGAERGNL